jgi:diaminopimelate epimerase
MTRALIPFWKYHGAGNDFVVVDVRQTPIDDPVGLAIRVCQRRLGVGGDGLLLIGPPSAAGAQVSMRIVNADGSHAEMCGNGLRCVVKHALDPDPTASELTVETGAGLMACTAQRGEDGRVDTVRVDMGKPILDRAAIPVAGEGTPNPVREEILHPDGTTFRFTAVSMGNPHAVIFLDDPDDNEHADASPADLAKRYGPGLEPHERFPKKANIAFVRATGTHLTAAVYERGAGLTAACGTGACAIGVAAGLEDRVPFGTPLQVVLPGGTLTIEVDPHLERVYMTGPARLVYQSELYPDALASVEACRSLTALLE